ncbi:asparagine synthase-related protein [Thermodesulfatator atlanticus]|uniref:asparagine synthase-related protein n=1 Tax=Thermodesulfatator atlanticus TaxID=501497 RepID=UPI0003B3958E|nr:asparagine synthase-related protein [Thermodesulfatator atlanticus]
MPGLLGLIAKDGKINANEFSKMAQALRHKDTYTLFEQKEKAFALGFVSNNAFALSPQPLKNENALLFFDGEIYDNNGDIPDDEFFLKAYLSRKNFDFLKDLEGIFSFCLWDKSKDTIYVGVDKFGLKHIFYADLPESFLFAAELKAFTRHSNFPKDLDFLTLAELFHFGFALGEGTLFERAKLLPNATILAYNLREKSFGLTKYWDEKGLFTPRGGHKRLPYQEICLLFGQAVQKRARPKDRLGLSISGGLDSRSILAALGEKARGLPSYTLGLPGCQDERLAFRLAQAMGTKHKFVPITEETLKNFLSLARTLIYFSDGFYFPHESTEKTALDYFERADFRILMRGHGGELVKCALAFPVQVDKAVSSAPTPTLLAEILFRKTNLVLCDFPGEALFQNKELRASYQALSKTCLNFVKAYYDDYLPEDVFMLFYLKEYIHRQAVASLNIFRTEIECSIPFLDSRFLRQAFLLPPHLRYDGQIQKAIVKHFAPPLVKIPDSNTGAPLDAGKLRLFLIDKFNAVLKRLSIPGFRHYTEFDRWQRKYFRQGIEKVIFNRRILERGLFQEKALKEIFDLHIYGKRNYARLLGTIVGIELWFRDFYD